MQGAWVPSLVREKDPTYCNYEFTCSKTWYNQIDK